ncbi:Prolyl 3-hydroxylase 1, partial [Stegodyphus mimosarum]
MQTNLQYYMTLPNINIEKIKYLEPKDYQDLFLKGAQLYSESKFIESIEVMEVSLKEYLSAEEDCRFQCEGPMLESSKEELFVAITNHFTYALRCNLNCPRKLAYMYGHVHEDLLAS